MLVGEIADNFDLVGAGIEHEIQQIDVGIAGGHVHIVMSLSFHDTPQQIAQIHDTVLSRGNEDRGRIRVRTYAAGRPLVLELGIIRHIVFGTQRIESGVLRGIYIGQRETVARFHRRISVPNIIVLVLVYRAVAAVEILVIRHVVIGFGDATGTDPSAGIVGGGRNSTRIALSRMFGAIAREEIGPGGLEIGDQAIETHGRRLFYRGICRGNDVGVIRCSAGGI